jgi:hypothetical protein
MILTTDNNNFADNLKKREARNWLVAMSNYYLKNREALEMLELLGFGIGAEFYSKNIKNISKIIALEKDKKLFNAYTVPENSNIFKYNCSITEFLTSFQDKKFDILNLDFCSFFCDIKMKTRESTGETLREVFNLKNFKKDSLIFTTFLLNGIHVKLNSYRDVILTDSDNIVAEIVKIASEYNVVLSPLDETFIYKPNTRGWNTMLHTGFIVNEM